MKTIFENLGGGYAQQGDYNLTNNTYLSLCRQKEVSFYAVFRDSVYIFFTIRKGRENALYTFMFLIFYSLFSSI